jgi:hypothetical protein
MDLSGAIIGAVIGGIVGLLVGIILRLLTPRRQCPDCGGKFPKLRGASTWGQFLLDRRTCRDCGCIIDRKGRKLVNW